MKITKFAHACFTVEIDGQVLVVDPGGFSTDFTAPDNVQAVIVTHVHADHLDKDHLSAITAKNPDAVILGPEQVTNELADFKTQTVKANEGVKIGVFELEFFGGEHAVIMESMPVDQNLAVMINGRLYHPGDSFTAPERPVEVLALPVAAPWLKVSEAADYLVTVSPQMAFPIHDAILSDAGRSMSDRMLTPIAEKVGATYQRLSDPIEI